MVTAAFILHVRRKVGYSSVFGRGDGTIMLDEVNCLGNEDNIGYCEHNPWTLSNCLHAQDVGVTCTPLGWYTH